MAAKLQQVPFVNEFKQTICPGDRVVVVSTGYSHSVHTAQGIYAGLSANGNPSVLVDDTKWGHWNAEGKDVGWIRANEPGIVAEHRPYKRRTTLPLGRVYKLAL